MVGIMGIVVALAILIFLAFRRWNMILVSLIASVIVGISNGLGFWSIFSDYYMPGAAGFISSWFLIFTIGSVYSEFMSRSGSVTAIAYRLVDIFGKDKILLVMLIVCCLLTIGGINPYVQIFIIWPMAVVFSKEFDIPRGLWLSVFYLGLFTATAFPGNPGMANTVVSQILEVSAATAPVFSLAMFIVYFISGYMVIQFTRKKWAKQGKHYVETRRDTEMTGSDRNNCPGIFTALLPMILVIILYTGFSGGWFAVIGIEKISASNAILLSMAVACLVCYLFNRKRLAGSEKDIVFKGMSGGINPTFAAAVISGFLGGITGSEGFAFFVTTVQTVGGHPYMQCLIAGNVLGFITGAGAVTAQTVLGTFGPGWIANPAVNVGILRELTTCNVSGGITLSPHSGGLHGVMGFAGTDLKESYPACILSVIIPSIVVNIVFTFIAMLL